MSRPGHERYERRGRIGSGGISEVYRALDRETGREVALKWLLPQLAADRMVKLSFVREAEIQRGLMHPNLLPALDAGEAEGRPFVIFPLAQGGDLRAALDSHGPIGWPEAWPVLRALVGGLAYAHAAGVLHRDLKPQNVLLTCAAWPPKEHNVLLADFGLARAQALASMTGSSSMWGSPAYLAPERLGRGRPDPRSDLYGLGVLVYELVTGRLPYREDNPLGRLASVARGEAPPTPPPTGHADLDRLLTRLLAPDPADRPATVAEALTALHHPWGHALAAAATTALRCASCGASRPSDVPVCFACGTCALDVRHTPLAPWRLVLTQLKDDADTMDRLHALLTGLTGRQDIRLKFLFGDPRVSTPKERENAIRLPVVLFSELDEENAHALARAFDEIGVEALPTPHHRVGLLQGRSGGSSVARLGFGVGLGAAACVGAAVVDGAGSALVVGCASLGLIFALRDAGFVRPRSATTPTARFRLRDEGAGAPLARGILARAAAAIRTLAAPESRALLREAATELYRLTRAVEAQQPSGEAPARRTLALATPLLEQLLALGKRIDDLDRCLALGSDSDIARDLGMLNRRLSHAPPDERAPLREARAERERALVRRHELEDARTRLAVCFCDALADLKTLCRRARVLTTVDERDAAALEAASSDLEAALALPSLIPSIERNEKSEKAALSLLHVRS